MFIPSCWLELPYRYCQLLSKYVKLLVLTKYIFPISKKTRKNVSKNLFVLFLIFMGLKRRKKINQNIYSCYIWYYIFLCIRGIVRPYQRNINLSFILLFNVITLKQLIYCAKNQLKRIYCSLLPLRQHRR